ncbi:MAG: hypothetical protein IJL69_04455, partial [Oscillospiraceae bacterium]|nr:hypothetical protein [Oscillospiraceae bacterium]
AVLKEAGVIDSGGAGLAYIVEGMARVLRGEAPLSGAAASAETPDTAGKPDTAAAAAAVGPDSAMEFGYCTEVMLQLMADRGGMGLEAAEVSAFLSTVGDSVVAFRNGTRVKLHVHTFEPEKVLAWCRRYGEFVSVKVENMSIQHSESTVVNRFVRQTPARTERIPIGVVAVAQGDGLKELFTGFGADRIVDGQQTMNPSAEDFLNAFREVNADSVIVLPNNSNIILAARQAAELCTDSRVYVVESRSLAEGYAALTMLDLDSGDAAAVAEELNEVCRGVVTGEVTWAVRDSVVGGKTISKGDWLGLCGKELISVAPDKVSAACALADGLDLSDREVIVLIEGRDASAEERAAVAAHIRKKYPQKELYEADGGQDVYSFILALE